MSNARYRTIANPQTQSSPEVPTTQNLLERAKQVLGIALERAEASLRAGDGRVPLRDCLNVTRQLIAIARLEESAARRAERERKPGGPQRAAPVETAPGPAPSPAPALRPAPDIANASDFAKGSSHESSGKPEMASATVSPAPVQLPPPPG